MALNIAPMVNELGIVTKHVDAIMAGELDEHVPTILNFTLDDEPEKNIGKIIKLSGYTPDDPEYDFLSTLLLAISSSNPNKARQPVTASDVTRAKWARAAVVWIAMKGSPIAIKKAVANALETQLSTNGEGQRINDHSDIASRYILATVREYSHK